jgi:hypothetical protein
VSKNMDEQFMPSRGSPKPARGSTYTR